VFDRLVEEHGSDELVRKFKTRHQLIALLYGQLAGAASLREIEATMASHRGRLYHVGGQVPHRSTLADANRMRSPLVFSGLFQHMLGMATRAVRRKMGEAVLLIDSTSLHLAGVGAQWARFSVDLCGAKAHVIYDPDLACPVYHAISAANVNDITAAQAMPIEPGATYVFDLGYYDYRWWAELDQACCRIVTGSRPTRRFARPAICRWSRDRARGPIASAFCPPGRPGAARTRCNRRCVRSS
jgi:hypothetical protein